MRAGKYYETGDSLDGEFIEIIPGLNYSVYSGTDDAGEPVKVDSGYLRQTDKAGHYLVYSTMYGDERPYEIMEFDGGILVWDECAYRME